MSAEVQRLPASTWADVVPGGHIVIAFVTEQCSSSVLYLTRDNAAKLGQRLLALAETVELP
ncbi:hypothetical protein A5634_18155 [Mycobacterium asiaticum]|uniref:Uncharacterized protein n=1 Tax=Mycobacterium asiaticum TaxID=1790 RepID=A0A1A3P5T4_MYCAS|nr:hypothetical protein [Mycobacterium asiaticum]OBK29531.1 hypothetical protein A5634_18155 [Mycobacterium asiaticum]